MLSFSRKSETKYDAQDIPKLLDKTIELAYNDYDLKKRFDFRHIELKREYQDKLPPVYCDENQIQQVVFNLLKNAAQAIANQQVEEISSPPATVAPL